jgi:vacuolar-type H+-ATPase subunit C/Vma6
VGNKIPALREIRSLNELDRLLFPEAHPELPSRELLPDMEKRIERRAVQQILAILYSYTEPAELLVRQLMVYEYSDLKTCLDHIASGIKNLPLLCDIGRYRTIHFEAFPDLDAMLRGTEYKFILSKNLKALKPDSKEFAAIEIDLDTRYYLGLMDSLTHLSDDDSAAAQKILADEISLRNCTWALRLRTYFKKTATEAGGYLMGKRMQGDPAKNLAAAAAGSLELPLDSRAPWKGWKWEQFLNPEKPGEHWELDPRYFQNAASKYLYRLAWNSFHCVPMAVSAIFCYIKIKQFEEDILTSVSEGLGMGMGSADVFDLLEVSHG